MNGVLENEVMKGTSYHTIPYHTSTYCQDKGPDRSETDKLLNSKAPPKVPQESSAVFFRRYFIDFFF